MIALCSQHAAHADDGLYADDYLRELKRDAALHAPKVRAQLEWMKRDMLACIGGSFFYETYNILQIGSVKALWFGRDEDGYLLLNVRMPTLSGMSRLRIEDNFLVADPGPLADFECTARGRKLRVRYWGGDRFALEFFELSDEEAVRKRYGDSTPENIGRYVTFPTTGVEIWETTANTVLEFGPKVTTAFGSSFSGALAVRCGGVIRIDCPDDDLGSYFPDLAHATRRKLSG